jgi:hypothetical protein
LILRVRAAPLLCAALLASGIAVACDRGSSGSSSDSSPAAPSTSTGRDAAEVAAAALAGAGDLPPGWAVGRSPAADAESTPCHGERPRAVETRAFRRRADAPDATDSTGAALPVARQTVSVFPDEASARRAVTATASSEFARCTGRRFAAGGEATYALERATRLAVPSLGDQRARARLVMDARLRDTQLGVELDVTAVRYGTVVVQLEIASADLFPVPEGEAAALLDAVAARTESAARAPGS